MTKSRRSKQVEAIVEAIAGEWPTRAGLAGGGRRETPMPAFDMGEPTVNLDKALALAGAMEDEELVRRLQLRR